jgi:hypothetical protein
MKTMSFISIFILGIFVSFGGFAQGKQKEVIKVWGSCGMCQKKIESAAKEAGAKSASWSAESQELKVVYNSDVTSSAKIQEAIAKTGYDTQDFTADQSAYDNLHGCCKYQRKAASNSSVHGCCTEPTCGKENATCKEKGCCKEKSCCKS